MLDALRDGARHGYEIIKSLEERSGGAYTPSPGVVYPTLQMLAEAGLVHGEQDGERRVFTLTASGQEELQSHEAEVAAFWAHFERPEGRARAEIRFVEEELEYLIRTVRNVLHSHPEPELVRQVGEALEACRKDVRRLIAGETRP